MFYNWLTRKVFFLFIFLSVSTAAFSEDAGTVLMEMERRVGALEEIVHELTGKIEELQHALKMMPSTEGPLSSPPSPSLPSSSGLSAGASTAMTGSASSTLGTAHDGVPSSSPFSKARDGGSFEGAPLSLKDDAKPKDTQEVYDAARKMLNRGAYEEAELAFKAFIANHKESPLVLNAHYWLGETYYGRQDYARSSVAFMEAYKAYKAQRNAGHSGNEFLKAPESLIKLIFSLRGMSKKANACATYKQLRKEFPKLSSNLERLATRSIEGLNCS